MKQEQTVSLQGRSLSFETGKIAKQAGGSCVVRMGDTVVLATACAQTEAKPGTDFLPLTVAYRENADAAGRIPCGFSKREGRPTEKEILTSRLIDRPLRPLFPSGYAHETQVIAFVLSADGQNDSDVLAINGASAALAVSAIPFTNTIGAVRVGRMDGSLIVNPTNKEREESDIDLIVAATRDAVCMVEAGAHEVTEAAMVDAIFFGHEMARQVIEAIERLAASVGTPKPEFSSPAPYEKEFFDSVYKKWERPMLAALTVPGKILSYSRIKDVKKGALAEVPAENEELRSKTSKAMDALVKVLTRQTILERNERLDGRSFEQIRAIDCEVGLLPRTHGSALFTRGETQALVTCTLGTSEDTQLVEDYQGDSE